ncbi:hypothetical protein GCM10028801_35860 [Nocardioides maradonensis]
MPAAHRRARRAHAAPRSRGPWRATVALTASAAVFLTAALSSASAAPTGDTTTSTGQDFSIAITSPADGASLPVGTTSAPVAGTISIGNVPVTGEAHVVFVIDESGSLGTQNFQTEKNAAIGLFNQIRNTSGLSVNTSLIFFSSNVETVLADQPAADNFVTAVQNHPYPGGNTFTKDAMTAAQTQLAGKSGIEQVILITDGAPNPASTQTPTQQQRTVFDAEGAAVYVYSVGSQGVCAPLQVIATKCTLVPTFTSLPGTLTGTPPAGIKGVEISVDGGAGTPVTSVNSLGQISATASGLQPGDDTIELRGTATDGTHVSADITVHVAVPDTTPPDTSIDTGPSATVGSSSASFTYSGTPGDTDHFTCTLDGSALPCANDGTTVTGLADGSHTFTVAAVDAAGNVDLTPASRDWTVDTTAPDTSIDSGPSATVGSGSASFTYSGTPASDTDHFTCTLDGSTVPCGSGGKSFSGLGDGSHTFTVAAVDAVGNVDPTPASRTWTVDTTAPDTSIDSGPSGTVPSGRASFTYSGTPASDTDHFTCTLDGSPVTCANTGRTVTGLADGSHTFMVAAVDAVGNVDGTPASRTWRVDTTPPDTSIDSGPSGTVASSSASFTYSGTPASDTDHFTCTLDGSPVTCTNTGRTVTGLADGSHTFTVAGVDAVGNVDGTPASRTWRVDTTPPDTSIDSGPSGTVASSSASFTYSGTPASDTAHITCTLDGSPVTCADTGRTVTGLADGSHTFTVAAVDAVGNVDPSPAGRTWTVDTTPPDTSIDSGPTGTVATGTAAFTYSGTPAIDTDHFVCALDGMAAMCPNTGVTLTGLGVGSHTFTVAAVDAVGNVDPTPASRTWVVDAPPVAALSASPGTGETGQTVTFSTAGTSDPDGAPDLASWTLSYGDGAPAASGTGAPPVSATHAYAAAGSYTAKLTVTDRTGLSGSATAAVTVNRSATTLVAAPDIATVSVSGLLFSTGLSALVSANIALHPAATLTRTRDGSPVVGRTVSFTTAGGAPICSATTDATGKAACGGVLTVIPITLGGSYQAKFAGDPAYAPSTATGSLALVVIKLS